MKAGRDYVAVPHDSSLSIELKKFLDWLRLRVVSSSSLTPEIPSGIVDGVNRNFTFTKVPSLVFVNGLLNLVDTHYVLNGKTVSFSVAPDVDANVLGLSIS